MAWIQLVSASKRWLNRKANCDKIGLYADLRGKAWHRKANLGYIRSQSNNRSDPAQGGLKCQSRVDGYVGSLSQAVRETLSYAEIVGDRFHVMQQLNHQIDLLRRAIQKKAKKEGNEALYQVLKGSRWVLLKNRGELKHEQETQLCAILELSDELREHLFAQRRIPHHL